MPAQIIPFQQKLYEMIQPSLTPRPPRGTMGQGPTSGPSYFDVNGKPITSIACGGSFTFDVPGSGLSQVWLTIYKNGTKTFDGLFSIPMQTYVTTCDNDIGQYQLQVFDPSSGISLGQTSINITAATGPTTPTGGIMAWLQNLTTTEKLALAGAGAFLLLRKKHK